VWSTTFFWHRPPRCWSGHSYRLWNDCVSGCASVCLSFRYRHIPVLLKTFFDLIFPSNLGPSLQVTLVSVNEPQEVLELSPASMDDSFEPATPFYRLRALLDWIAEALRPFKDPNFRWACLHLSSLRRSHPDCWTFYFCFLLPCAHVFLGFLDAVPLYCWIPSHHSGAFLCQRYRIIGSTRS